MNASSTPTAANPTRILIVDDEEDNRELLAVILSWDGFVVSTAASGAEALASVAKDPPDIVLLDVMMPDMNGYEVLVALKGNAATRSIPVMMVSALSDANAKTRATDAGAEDLLAKPLDRARLVARVRTILGISQSGDFARVPES